MCFAYTLESFDPTYQVSTEGVIMDMNPHDRYWYDLICQCRESGLTDKQWCMEHDIHVSTFYRHARTLRNLSCEIPVGQKGRIQGVRQDVVPLQIIPDLPAGELATHSDELTAPAAGPIPSYKDGFQDGSFSPTLQVRFPNGVLLEVSNFSSPSVLNSVICALGHP